MLAFGATVAVALTGCASTTGGAGKADASGAGAASSAPDFPSTSATTAGRRSATAPGSGTASVSVSTPSAHPVPSTPIRTVTVIGRTRHYVIEVWAEVKDDTCYDHAYGRPVISYLTTHPCHGLSRRIATTKIDGRGVGFAQASLGFVGAAPAVYETAGNFEQLVTKDGTGNVDDLLRDGYRLPSGPSRVPYPDAFKVLGQDNGVTITDAWYLDGSTPDNDPGLVAMAEDIFLQF